MDNYLSTGHIRLCAKKSKQIQIIYLTVYTRGGQPFALVGQNMGQKSLVGQIFLQNELGGAKLKQSQPFNS